MTLQKEYRSTWGIGGGVVVGSGVGFFLLPPSAIYFVGSLMMGLGLGIIVSAIFSRKKN